MKLGPSWSWPKSVIREGHTYKPGEPGRRPQPGLAGHCSPGWLAPADSQPGRQLVVEPKNFINYLAEPENILPKREPEKAANRLPQVRPGGSRVAARLGPVQNYSET